MADPLASTRAMLRNRLTEAHAGMTQSLQQARDFEAKAEAARGEAGERQLEILQIRAALVVLDVDPRTGAACAPAPLRAAE